MSQTTSNAATKATEFLRGVGGKLGFLQCLAAGLAETTETADAFPEQAHADIRELVNEADAFAKRLEDMAAALWVRLPKE